MIYRIDVRVEEGEGLAVADFVAVAAEDIAIRLRGGVGAIPRRRGWTVEVIEVVATGERVLCAFADTDTAE